MQTSLRVVGQVPPTITTRKWPPAATTEAPVSVAANSHNRRMTSASQAGCNHNQKIAPDSVATDNHNLQQMAPVTVAAYKYDQQIAPFQWLRLPVQGCKWPPTAITSIRGLLQPQSKTSTIVRGQRTTIISKIQGQNRVQCQPTIAPVSKITYNHIRQMTPRSEAAYNDN